MRTIKKCPHYTQPKHKVEYNTVTYMSKWQVECKLMDNSFKQQDIYSTGNRAPNMRERTLITCSIHNTEWNIRVPYFCTIGC